MDPLNVHLQRTVAVSDNKRSLFQRLLPKCFQSSEKAERVCEAALGKVPAASMESRPVVHINPTVCESPVLPQASLTAMVAETKNLTQERQFLERLVTEFGGRGREERIGKKLSTAISLEHATELTRAVQERRPESIQSQLKSMPRTILMEVVPYVLRELATKDSHEEHNILMSQLREAYPSIESYVINDDKGPILSPEGIGVIVKYLQTHGSLVGECSVCKDIQTFEAELTALKSNPEDGRRCFIVRNFGNHVTPVYVEKTGDKYRCVITDSVGNKSTGDGGYFKAIYGSLFDILENPKTDFRVFASTFCRQRDQTNCPIFSLRDAVYLSQHGHTMTQDLERTALTTLEDEGRMFRFLRPFEKLPPTMMMTTQFIKTLADYDSKNPPADSVYARIKSKGYIETPPSGLAGETREINNLINSRAQKYERLLMTAVIGLTMGQEESPHHNA